MNDIAEALAVPLPLLPLRHGLVLPGSFVTVPVGRPRSRALADATPLDGLLLLGIQRDPKESDPAFEDLHPYAVLARVKQKNDRGQRGVLLLVEGITRVRLTELNNREPFFRARGEVLPESNVDAPEGAVLAESLRNELLSDDTLGDRAFRQLLRETTEPGRLADRLTIFVDAPHDARLDVLFELDVVARLRLVTDLVARAKARAELKESIDSEVRSRLGKNQKEAVLREQLKAIRKELGDAGGDGDDPLRERLEGIELPEEAREVVERELKRLESLGDNHPDAALTRKYLELIADLPWGRSRAGLGRPQRRRGGARGRPRGPRRGEEADPRAHGGAEALREGPGHHPVSRRPAGASARPASPSRWPAPPVARFSASPSAACGTRPRSAATAAPTSGRSPAASWPRSASPR